MRQAAIEVSYEEKTNFTELPGIPATQQIGKNEINQLKTVTTDHAALLNTLPLIDKYVCSDETTSLVPGILYTDIISSDLTLHSIIVNVTSAVINTDLTLNITIGVSVYPITILITENVTILTVIPTDIPALTPIQVEVVTADPATLGLKMKLIGEFTVAPI